MYTYKHPPEHIYERAHRRVLGFIQAARIARGQAVNIARMGAASAGLQQRRLQNTHSSSSNAPSMPRLPQTPPFTPARSRSMSSGSSMQSLRFDRPRSMSVGSAQSAPAARARSVSSGALNNRNGQFYRIAPAVIVKGRRIGTKGGFVKTKKLLGKKFLKRGDTKLRLKGGYNLIRETGEVQSRGQHCAYIGHTSTILTDLHRAVWGALFNKLMFKASVLQWGPTSTVTFDVNTSINIQYKIAGTGSLVNEQYAPGAVSVSPDTFITWATSNLRPWNDNTVNETRFEFYRMSVNCSSYNPEIRSNVEINLFNTQIKYFCKSALKIQNRSKTGTSTEADVVDDVPLYGKAYYGKGQGPVLNAPLSSTINLIADSTTGVIFPATVTDSFLQEPLNPIELAKVKSYGKISINPGQIKTSVVIERKTMYFNTLMAKLIPRRGLASNNCPLGKFRLMALEKIMHVDATLINLAYECQCNTTVAITEKKRQLQTSSVVVQTK